MSELDFEQLSVSPGQAKNIRDYLKENPRRFKNADEFVFRALDLFLEWEKNPKVAEAKMVEMELTIPQLALMKMKMKPEELEAMFPGLAEKHKEEVENFLVAHPEYKIPQQGSKQDTQQQERSSKKDLEKLINAMSEAVPFVRDTDFPKPPEKDQIPYDGWPLLWSHYSRILPAKIALVTIGDIMFKEKSSVIILNDSNRAHIYDIAEELSTKLRAHESTNKIERNQRLSTGLPKQAKDLKDMTREERITQGNVEKRYYDRVIGNVGKNKDLGKKVFNGMLSALGLVTAWKDEESGDDCLTFTEKGKMFYLLPNPVLNEDYSTSFSPEERKILLKEILPQRELEMKLIRTAAKVIRETNNVPLKMSVQLDSDFAVTVNNFINSNKEDAFVKKIESEVAAKIETYRIAVMGRLSEIGLIRWEIEGEKGRPGFTKSNYFTSDEEMMLVLSTPEED